MLALKVVVARQPQLVIFVTILSVIATDSYLLRTPPHCPFRLSVLRPDTCFTSLLRAARVLTRRACVASLREERLESIFNVVSVQLI